jgi:hypothetical protein
MTPLLTPDDAARAIGLSKSFLAKSRIDGSGPHFLKLGARVFYDPADLCAWVNRRRRASTSDNDQRRD